MNTGPISTANSPQAGSHPPTTRSMPSADPSRASGDLRAKVGDAVSTLTDVAQQAVGEAKRSASSLTSEAGAKVKDVLSQQVATGATLVSHVAASAKAAADNLDGNAPQLASFVRDASDRLDEFSRDIRGKSVDEIVETTSEFVRRRPAAVFGAAAACGFLLFRLFKAAPRRHDADRATGGSGRDGLQSGGLRENRFPQAGSPPISPHDGQFHGA